MAGTVTPGVRLHRVLVGAAVRELPHFHQGIDIVAPYGTPIHASGHGAVVYIGWNYADGSDPAWIVIIAHCQSLQTWYAHMQPQHPGGIHAGSARQRRARSSATRATPATRTGAHLHWAVR